MLSRAPSNCPALRELVSVHLCHNHESEHLIENREVEGVVVVGDGDVPACSNADPDRKVGDAFAADLPQVVALIVEHLDTVGSVVADEHLLLVVHGDAIGELKMPAESCA